MSRVIYEDDCVTVTVARTGRRCDPGGEMSRRVRRVEYDHVQDGPGVYRRHDFAPGVQMIALPGHRAVLLVGERGQDLVRDY